MKLSSHISLITASIKLKWLAVLLMLLIAGCSTPQWNTRLWIAQKPLNEDKPEIGSLQTGKVRYNFIVTGFSKRKTGKSLNGKKNSPLPSFIGISISVKNLADETLMLENSPIQIIDASKTLVKQLHQEHVVYKLYGGRLRERQLEARLAELNEPLPSVGSDILSSLLSTIVEMERAKARNKIVDEMYSKEAAPYQLYHQSFSPTSLPPDISTIWTEYYPYTTYPITVILQGQNVEDGISFEPPPLPQKTGSDEKEQEQLSLKDILLATSVGVLFVVFMISITGNGTE